MKNNFIDYLHKYSSGGKSSPIHIKKENEGKFTQSAKEHGMGVQEYAQSVLNNPNASALQKKRANFARNAAKWKHQTGGAIYKVPEIPKLQPMPKTQINLGLGGNYNLENGGYSSSNFYMHPTISHQFDKGWGLSVSPGTFVHNSEKYPGGNFRLTGFLPEHSVTVSKSFQEGGQFGSILNRVYKSNTNFAKRLKDSNRKFIPDWATDAIATHKMGVGTDENGQPYIFPQVQEINGELIDFTRPPYNRGAGMISAEERGDTIHVPTIKDGVEFTENYKKYFPNFQTGGTIPVGKVAKSAYKIFKGDHLKLMKQRLKNRGFERLAKTAKEDEAIKPSPGGMGEYKQNLLTKNKDWLLAQEPMKVSSKELEEYKRKHGLPKPATSPKSGASSQFGKYYTDLYTDAPEKLKAIPNDKHQIAAHEYSHFVYKPSTTAPGFNYDKFPTAGQYFHGKNGSSELAARGSQLKNYFGLNKGSDDITPEMLTYAKEHYVKDTGIDNNMTSMFESVEDSNKFSNWISKNAPLIPLELTMKSIMLKNQPDPLSAKKGSKIAKHSWSADFGHTVDGNPNLDNMKGDYVTKKKRKKAQYGTKLNYLKSLYY